MQIADFLMDAASAAPDATAVSFRGVRASYAQLDAWATSAAAKLVELGTQPGDRVAMLLPSHAKLIVLYHAIHKLGAVVVPLNALLTQPEIAYELENAGASLLLTTEGLQRNVPAPEALADLEAVVLVDPARPFEDGLFGTEGETAIARQPLGSEDPAVILYTSGTLERPRGAVLTHGNVTSNVLATVAATRMTADDRLLCCLPLYHCFGQNFVMNAAIRAQAQLILQERFELEVVLEAIEASQATMFFGVPTMYRRILEADVPAARLASLRYVFSAAATLPIPVSRAWRERYGLPIHEGYGLTETSPCATYNHVSAWKEGSVGQAVDGVRIKVVDPASGVELGAGERGEILVSGPNIMQGYYGDPAATARVIEDGWFATGDLGYCDVEGYLFLVGRLKEMINPGGNSVSPREIEAVLQGHASVRDVAVVGVPDDDLGERIKAYVVATPELSETELIGYARQRLAAFKVPRQIQLVDEIPRAEDTGRRLRRLLQRGIRARRVVEPGPASDG